MRWRVRCPQVWDALAPTADARVRRCAQCEKDVHFCTDDRETIAHARAGHCIAREEPGADELPRLVIGQVVEARTPAQDAALARKQRERGIAEALRSSDGGASERTCPECGYAVPGFRVTCYVCRHELGPA